ncbi:transposase [Methylocystis sp. H62]|uniref:IS110 family transposase n=1 Tax=Methylocystis sp. H62 TaxID=2785789 RepID=UPI0018C34359|nr:transposase [Methylocystis sp. H62]MBG0792170.1 transposase [Methylocystis sp. H62]
MSYYVGLDVSVKLTAICIIDDAGNAVMERVVASDPDDIGRCIEEFDGEIGRIGLEAAPLAPWLFGGLAERGLPVVCIEVRQMKAFAKASPINDARLIAQAMRTESWPRKFGQ